MVLCLLWYLLPMPPVGKQILGIIIIVLLVYILLSFMGISLSGFHTRRGYG